LIVRAPAKLNLCLYLGPRRADRLHELCSLTDALTLSDRILIGDARRDEVRCDDVDGPNLAERALEALRERGWSRPPLSIEIEKRIPIAAGLGGGSADAAAVLRLARNEVNDLVGLAAEIGADVPAQLDPGRALVRGAGERVERLERSEEYAVVLIPAAGGLATSDVYTEADRLGLGRESSKLDALGERLVDAAGGGASPLAYLELLENDLQPAALSLHPEIGDAIRALESVGAARALITGSGPTAFGLFPDKAIADRAAASLPPRYADAVVAAPGSLR
jgi:4-diphosphocytidyl-2-C-methyl-D-erythritol kinase